MTKQDEINEIQGQRMIKQAYLNDRKFEQAKIETAELVTMEAKFFNKYKSYAPVLGG